MPAVPQNPADAASAALAMQLKHSVTHPGGTIVAQLRQMMLEAKQMAETKEPFAQKVKNIWLRDDCPLIKIGDQKVVLRLELPGSYVEVRKGIASDSPKHPVSVVQVFDDVMLSPQNLYIGKYRDAVPALDIARHLALAAEKAKVAIRIQEDSVSRAFAALTNKSVTTVYSMHLAADPLQPSAPPIVQPAAAQESSRTWWASLRSRWPLGWQWKRSLSTENQVKKEGVFSMFSKLRFLALVVSCVFAGGVIQKSAVDVPGTALDVVKSVLGISSSVTTSTKIYAGTLEKYKDGCYFFTDGTVITDIEITGPVYFGLPGVIYRSPLGTVYMELAPQ